MKEGLIAPTLQVLHFVTQNVRMCVELEYVNKVNEIMLLEEVPTSPDYVAGLMNFSGQSITIIDLALYFGMPRKKIYSLESPIIMCSSKYGQMGMIVDSIFGLATINIDEMQMRDQLAKTDSPFLGAVTIDSELSLLLNLKQIFLMNPLSNSSAIKLDNGIIDISTIE